MLQDFKAFLTKSNALALAVGIIIGAATNKVVSGIVEDLMMSNIGLALLSGDWREAKLVLRTVTDADGNATTSSIAYGHLLGTLLDFVFIAFIVFLLTKALLKPLPYAATPTKNCPECLEAIQAEVRKCKACGSSMA